jgi:hypothetical protein
MNHFSSLSTRFTCISSAPENRKMGRDLAVLLESTVFNQNLVGKIFQVLLEYPYGAPWVRSLFRMAERAINDEFISLTSPMPRHNKFGDAPFIACFPNPFRGAVSARALKTLRVNEVSLAAVLTHEFSRLLGADHPLYPATQALQPISAKNLFAILESIIRLEIFPPGVVAAANFRIDSANLTGPCAGGEAGKKDVHHRKRRTRGAYEKHAQVLKSIRNIRKAIGAESKGALTNLMVDNAQHIFNQFQAEDESLDKLATEIVLRVLQGMASKSRQWTATTYLTVIQCFPDVLEVERFGERCGPQKGFQRYHMQAAKLIDEHYPLSPNTFETIRSGRKTERARHLALGSPDDLFRVLGLGPSFASTNKIDELASYVLRALLGFNGRRSVCLIELELRHLKKLGSIREIIVPSTKGRERNSILPIDWLWPEYALTAFDALVDACKTSSTSPSTRLSELAGFGSFKREQNEFFRGALLKEINRRVEQKSRLQSTHFARSWWYSWMVVRVYCAWFPELLRNPILADHLENPLFEKSCLRRLLNIFPSPCSDLLAGLQNLASHSSGERPWKNYIRSAPILTRLLHDLEYASHCV